MKLGRLDKDSVLLQYQDEVIDQILRHAEFKPQDSLEFTQSLVRDAKVVGTKNLTQDVLAKPASRCRARQYVGIEKDLHDTSANTSSPVR